MSDLAFEAFELRRSAGLSGTRSLAPPRFGSWALAPVGAHERYHSSASLATASAQGTMKAILQRVHSASVTVEKQLVSQINRGVLVLAAVHKDDSAAQAEALAAKVVKMKLWDDDAGGRWKNNVSEINGEILCVSQFTLYANTKKGNKPDFHASAGPEKGKDLYEHFFAKVQELLGATRVKNGVFGAMMDVQLINDGPVTIELNSDAPKEGTSNTSGKPPKS